ncbi:MAG TPA: DUF4339 domain-containing protein [Steroidobacteraceae bacterium]|jgi:hypothetical protein
MSTDRRWYLEVSGRRAGPFAWTVLVELAQAGALGAEDRVWRMQLASWSRAVDLIDLAALIREPAPARTFASSGRNANSAGRRVHPLLLAAAIAWLALALLAGHWLEGGAAGSSPSGDSAAAFSGQASAFERGYPFLTELRRIEPSGFERLDRAVRLGFRRGAPAAELNGSVAEAANDIERTRLAEVDDPSALRLLVALRAAARRFQSSDPTQCVAILGLQSAGTPVRSAAALSAISPALVGLLDAPARPHGALEGHRNPLPPISATLSQTLTGTGPDVPDVDSRLNCDRLLLMYDTAVAASPDTGATFIRTLQGDSGP